MDLNNKVTQLEDEIKVLKKEVQSVLLDLRENMLNRENPFAPQAQQAQSNVSVSVQSPPPAEEKKLQEEKPKEITPVKDEVQLPAAITEAFRPEEVKTPDQPQVNDDMVLAWKTTGTSEKNGLLNGITSSAPENINKNALETVTSLVGWAETSMARLGFERTQAILDISEMMGHLSPEMKNIMVKFMRPGIEPVEKVSFKDYMASLMELAGPLGKKNDPNNVLFYTLYHGMYSMTEGQGKHG